MGRLRGRDLAWLMIGLLAFIGVAAAPAAAQPSVETLAELPPGDAAYGVAVGRDRLLYVSDVGGPRSGTIFVFEQSGELHDRLVVPAGPSGVVSLRGLAFDSQGNLHVADAADGRAGRGRVVKISQRGRQSTLASGLTAPGALTFDRSDVLYVTDGENGSVIWIGRDGASATFIEDELLRPHSRYGQGASGLAFARDETVLYVSNAADDRILRVSINDDGSAGRLRLLADRPSLPRWRGGPGGSARGMLDGPEGLAVDDRGNLLVAAGRSDAVELFSAEGRPLHHVHSSSGSGFSSPTSLALFGGSVYVANLAVEHGRSRVSRFTIDDLDD